MKATKAIFQFFIVLCSIGCVKSKPPFNYEQFHKHPPKSILVLPPLNQSTDIKGTYSYLSTVTRPIAEMGYYVFPVAIIDELMKENGLPTAGEMHQASLKKISEIIHPDAVLYITLKQYGTKFQVLDSSSVVEVNGKLVDTKSGLLLWEGESTVYESANEGANYGSADPLSSLVGMFVTAAVSQAVSSGTDRAHLVCKKANDYLFSIPGHGLLYGPYHPKHDTLNK